LASFTPWISNCIPSNSGKTSRICLREVFLLKPSSKINKQWKLLPPPSVLESSVQMAEKDTLNEASSLPRTISWL